MPVWRIDEYDERVMYGVLFPLVAAFPTAETIAAVMPVQHRLSTPPPGHALRRRSPDAWSAVNTLVVRIPDELLQGHTAEVADVLTQQRIPSAPTRSSGLFDAYADAQLGLMRGRIADPERWAHEVVSSTEREMIALAEHTGDWSPWSPMIRFGSLLRELDDNLVRRAAEHRLRLIARRLLDAQGFTDVLVDDTLGLPPQMQRAVTTLLGRE